ncbi:polyamine-binding protein [Halopseudomonas oceani]|uniref:Putrescine-binding periplasmic protein n=1 Tax=Halopseudomonas oceani TaxID=1708783 RepID=A0A2P4EWY7_9GAMM|nr:extracellular solute-binding protein [Halopseudomonas oceani]POB04504.1 polyamine ABC transporter substrate-binding protein [Halopseudomonas oceani]GGE39730.1 polyamine-binding protein [Halopseudomonas oceani]
MKYLLCIVALCAVSQAHAEDVIRVLNWNDYIEPTLLEKFEQQSGVRVDYQTFEEGQELMEAMGSGDAYDIVVPSHYMLKQLIADEALMPIDSSQLKNHDNLDLWLVSVLASIPRASEHAIPYLWGSNGLAVNVPMAEAALGESVPHSWGLLFSESYASRLASCGLGMLAAPEEVASVLLNFHGRRLSGSTGRRIAHAFESIDYLRKDMSEINNWEHVEALAKNEICVALTWGGNALFAMEENPDVQFWIPEAGSSIFIDTLAIPSNASRPDLAYQFIDFLMEPENAILNASASNFYPPISGDSPEMQAFEAANPYQVMTVEQRRRSYLLESLTEEQQSAVEQAWQRFLEVSETAEPEA